MHQEPTSKNADYATLNARYIQRMSTEDSGIKVREPMRKIFF